MIPAPPGCYVSTKRERKNGSHYWESTPVVAFDDEGVPLIAGYVGCAALRRPVSEYTVMFEPLRQLIPADGWYAVFTDIDGEEFRVRLRCWTYNDRGRVVGMDAEGRIIDDRGDCFLAFAHRPDAQALSAAANGEARP